MVTNSDNDGDVNKMMTIMVVDKNANSDYWWI